jgi:malonyl CoA-acyl carrier protein transacylase
MKKLFFLVSILILASTACKTSKEDNSKSLDENKRISTLYHERNLEDVDKLMSEDFVGSFYYKDLKPVIWNKENHKNAITSNPNVKDSILIQIVEGEWVAERFIRTLKNEDTIRKAEVMQFKQIKDGKIIRSWELINAIY